MIVQVRRDTFYFEGNLTLFDTELKNYMHTDYYFSLLFFLQKEEITVVFCQNTLLTPDEFCLSWVRFSPSPAIFNSNQLPR